MQKGCVNYAMLDGLLHHLVRVKEEPYWPLVVPKSLQEYILLLFHNHAASAHFSEGKRMQRLLRRFTWKFMSTDVHNYAKGCLFCKQRKTAQDMRAGTPGVMPMPTGPRIIVTLDFVGPIVPSVPHGSHTYSACIVISHAMESQLPTNCLVLNPKTGSKDSINVAKFEPFVPLKAKREKMWQLSMNNCSEKQQADPLQHQLLLRHHLSAAVKYLHHIQLPLIHSSSSSSNYHF